MANSESLSPEAAGVALFALLGQATNAALAFLFVAALSTGDLGTWGLASSLTQYLDVGGLGAVQFLSMAGLRAPTLEKLQGYESETLGVLLRVVPLAVLLFTLFAALAGIGGLAVLAFGAASGLVVLNGWYVARLRIRGRLGIAGALLVVDRFTVLVVLGFLWISSDSDISADHVAFAWLGGQLVLFGLAATRLPRVTPSFSGSVLARRSYLWMAIAGAGTSGISSLARVPLAFFGVEKVGTFVAATYLALPILAITGAVDQVAFVRAKAAWGEASRPVWRRATVLVVSAAITTALAMALVGPALLERLSTDYSGVRGILGAVLAWAVGLGIVGIAMKALFAQDRLRLAALLATSVAVIGALAIWAAYLVGLTYTAAVTAYALASLTAMAVVVQVSGIASMIKRGER